MTDTCSDIESVRRLVKKAGWRRIGIDGVDGAGKSRLAAALSKAFEYPALDVDDYLHRNQGGYVDFIDYPALKTAVSTMPAFILSGACLREILSNLGASLDGNIYIKRMHGGLWADEDVCVFPDGVDAAIDNLVMSAAMSSRHFDDAENAVAHGDDALPHLANEIMRYHDSYRPYETADLIFERHGDTG